VPDVLIRCENRREFLFYDRRMARLSGKLLFGGPSFGGKGLNAVYIVGGKIVRIVLEPRKVTR
jgi:hypothetical protein